MSRRTPSPDKTLREELGTYRRLLRYASPYKLRLVLGLLFGMVFGGSYFGILMSIRKNLTVMFDPADLPLQTILTVAAMLPAFAALMGLGNYLSKYFVEWVGNRVVMDLRNQTFSHIHDLSLLYFTRSRTGELISRTTNDSMLVQRAVSTVLGNLAREPFALVAAVGYLIYLDPLLSTASLILFPICIIPVALFGRRVRRAAREGQEKLADLVTVIQETVSGVRIVKAFGMEDKEKQKFSRLNRSVFGRLMQIARSRAAVEPIIVTISALGLSLVLLYARRSGMGAGEFFSFAAALVMLYQPAKKLSHIHLHIQQSCAAADRIFEVVDTEILVKESPDAIAFDEPIRDVRFQDVAFAYEDDPVLRGISLSVESGECIAVVGSSGTGKTTLLSLVPRFFDVTSGAILINGKDIRQFTLKSLRRQIGIVTQETILFNDTVANNIAYGQESATMEEITDAAKRARAHDFVSAMPQGYDTVIGERGVRISGGECQRLAIARAMLRNPPILILDEATSALDTESERLVQAALNELMSHRTVFAIAHRLSTVTHADRIIVLDKGRIVEQGKHKDLLAKDGIYRRLYDLQFRD